MKQRLLRLPALLLALCCLFSAFPVMATAEGEATVTLSPGEVEFWVGFGSPCELKTTVTGAPEGSVVRYASSDAGIASVSETGNLTPLSLGVTYVTATLTNADGTAVYATSNTVTVRVVENPITIPEGSDPENQLFNLGSTSVPRIDKDEFLTWPTEYGNAHVTLWKDGKTGVVTMTVDDNIMAEFAFWNELLLQYGLPTTFIAPTSGYSEAASMWQYETTLGQAVQSHTHGHPSGGDYDKMSTAEVWMDFYLGYLEIGKYSGSPSRIIGYSYGWNNAEYSSKIYIAGRGTTGSANGVTATNYNQTASFSGLNSSYMTKFNAITEGSGRGGWCSVHWHSVSRSTDLVRQIYASLYELSEQRKIWTATFADAAMYGQERDTSILTVTGSSDNVFSFVLTDRMNDNYYDFPLTVAIRADSRWQAAAAMQNGVEREVEVVEKDGATYLLVQAVPDRGEVTVRRLTLSGEQTEDGMISFVPEEASSPLSSLCRKTFTFAVDASWQHAWAVQDGAALPVRLYTEAGVRYAAVTCIPGRGRVVLCREAADSDLALSPECTMTDVSEGRVTPTEGKTVTVSSAEELNLLADYVNIGHNMAGVTVLLTCDIDLSDTPLCRPVGWKLEGEKSSTLRFYYPFSGIFDGAGHSITGLFYDADVCGTGLFGYTDGATIKDLSVSGQLSGIKWVGGLVGSMNGGTLQNCRFTGSVSSAGFGQRNSGSYTGGLVGQLIGGTVSGCTANAAVHTTAGDGDNSGNYTGGLVGTYGGNATVTRCVFSGTVTAVATEGGKGARHVGGLVGGGDKATLRDSVFSGTVSGEQYVGGLVGTLSSNAEHAVYNCAASGSVTGVTYVGGISGIMSPSSRAKCKNCLADVNVTATGEEAVAGRLFGAINAGNNNPSPSSLFYPAGDSPLPLFVPQGTKNPSAKAYAYTPAHLDGTATEALTGGKTSLVDALNVWVEANAAGGYGTWSMTAGESLPVPVRLTYDAPVAHTPAAAVNDAGQAFDAAIGSLSADSSVFENYAAFDTAFRLLSGLNPAHADIADILWLTEAALAYNAEIASGRSAMLCLVRLGQVLSARAMQENTDTPAAEAAAPTAP